MSKKAVIGLFLLVVFFLNTVVGVACALAPHGCCHKHVVEMDHHCCNDSVLKFQQLDKSLEQHFNTVLSVPVILITLPALQVTYRSIPLSFRLVKQEPPPEDIRVSIQSFQI